MTTTLSAKPRHTSTIPTAAPAPIGKGSHVYLIDGSGFVFRAFHALPPLTRPSDGLPVGAVHGFCQMLWKLIGDSKNSDKPTHIAVIFDAGKECFRNAIYKNYKANRTEPPEEVTVQFPLIRDAVKAFNIACIELNGYEADDLIATYARQATASGGQVTIVSSDKDLMQLVRPGITMLDTLKNRRFGREEVIERFGVDPEKVVDVQALAGDTIDNVPGVPGIGVKTAAELINTYGSLEALLERAGEIKQPKRRERLVEFAAQARISRDLVRLHESVPVEISLEQMGVQEPDPPALLAFLRSMEFNTLTRRIAEALGAAAPPAVDKSVGTSLTKPGLPDPLATAKGRPAEAGTLSAAVAYWAKEAVAVPIDRSKYETVTTLERLEAWLEEARSAGRFAFDTETTSLAPMLAELVGFSLAVQPGKACYVPVGHRPAS
ncbi:MAG TPA: 5'-3' exonuclease H3TH domain-containing protein, partial [Hyphomicrobiaceae bacterium]|nr:5'-3' exonuclease H3TH domain-containing protein [Hyphomicrobiaceae bacterium]